MSLLQEIPGVGVTTLAWSPMKDTSSQRHIVALGSTENTELQLHALSADPSGVSSSAIVGCMHASSSFLSLSWADVLKHQSSCNLGLLAGGMADGSVSIWNAGKIVDDTANASASAAPVALVSKHKGAVHSVQFNPRHDRSHLLASGGA
jgi:protein transport protein SEC31